MHSNLPEREGMHSQGEVERMGRGLQEREKEGGGANRSLTASGNSWFPHCNRTFAEAFNKESNHASGWELA
jgi:hypothetical protein